MTIEEKARRIITDIRKEISTDPSAIFHHMAMLDNVSVHGPEHHVLDGACLLTAYANAGGDIDLSESLERLLVQGLKMPGAMCGLWGICGVVASVGAALAVIDHTGPLSTDGSWGAHMAFTAEASRELGTINGPRCCKRDGLLALKHGRDYLNARGNVHLEFAGTVCAFSDRNEQCIGERCPFFPKKES